MASCAGDEADKCIMYVYDKTPPKPKDALDKINEQLSIMIRAVHAGKTPRLSPRSMSDEDEDEEQHQAARRRACKANVGSTE